MSFWCWCPRPSPEAYDLCCCSYLLAGGSFSTSETIVLNASLTSLANGFNWTIPSRVEGEFWVGAVKRQVVNGVTRLFLVGYVGLHLAPTPLWLLQVLATLAN